MYKDFAILAMMQYVYAIDRDNKRVSNRFDVLSAPALRVLRAIADKADATGTALTLCGEMGGKPIEALALIALGFRGLSMSPSSVGPVKAMILAAPLGETRAFLAARLDEHDGAHSLREDLRAFAEARGIPL